MEPTQDNDRIPHAVQRIITLFNNELAEVRFPNIDGRALQQLADEVSSAAGAVTDAEQQLEAARARLQQTEEALLQRAQQALSYAQIFAQDDASTCELLQGIDLQPAAHPNAKTSRQPAAKKRAKRGEAARQAEAYQGEAEVSRPASEPEGAEHAA